MRYEPDRLDFDIRREALAQAINYINQFGGDVIEKAESFYCFLSNKIQPSPNAPMMSTTTNTFHKSP